MIHISSNIRLNLSNFLKLQGDMTEVEMAKKLNVSRSQLWRIKKKSSAVGQEFIIKFKKAYPNEKFEDYFFIENVEQNQQVD
jgi:transcriptional regulator with XRE-family HTH domain